MDVPKLAENTASLLIAFGSWRGGEWLVKLFTAAKTQSRADAVTAAKLQADGWVSLLEAHKQESAAQMTLLRAEIVDLRREVEECKSDRADLHRQLDEIRGGEKP